MTLLASLLTMLAPANPAQASPGCQDGGYYVIFVRGMTARLGSLDQKEFLKHLHNLLPSAEWAELGNLDGSRNDGEQPDDLAHEYPAYWIDRYNESVTIGRNELVAHLNRRYGTTNVYGNMHCNTETVVIGGYSEGADVVGWAINSGDLSQAARDHIGYVALFGDPVFNRLCGLDRWWEMAPSTQDCGLLTSGYLGIRDPYAPSEFQGRLGSWCDRNDGFCNGLDVMGSHAHIYRDYWYRQVAHIIASFAVKKRKQLNPNQPPAVLGAYTDNLSATGPQAPPTQSVTLLQGLTAWPSSGAAIHQPLRFGYTVKNLSGSPASIARIEVAVRAPDGSAQDVPCANGEGVTLQPNATFTCDAQLPTGYGSIGTYTYWADWMGYDGAWHHGQLGSNKTFTLGAANTLSVVHPAGVSPSGNVPMYTPLTFSYRVKNTSGAEASIQRLAMAVRGPSGNALDVPCQNGTSVALPADAEFTCTATLPTGYGSQGTFTFWPDWQGWDGSWHQGQLGWNNTLVQGPPVSLSVPQALSQSPNSTLPVYVPLDFAFRVKNTSGGELSIQRLAVAVRGPSGDNLDLTCDNGYSVALAVNAEFLCHAQAPYGYGSTGTYTYWADWQGWDGSWHHGALSGDQHFTLTGIQTLYPIQGIQVLPTNYEPKLSPLSWTYTVHNSSNATANVKTFLVAVIGPAGDGLNVPCQGGTDVTIPAHGNWTCTANLPGGYGSTGQFRYRADWQGYDGVWHTGMLGAQYVLTLY